MSKIAIAALMLVGCGGRVETEPTTGDSGVCCWYIGPGGNFHERCGDLEAGPPEDRDAMAHASDAAFSGFPACGR